MISIIEQSVRKLYPDIPAHQKLSFLKFNTPGSVAGLYAKVIFLGFKEGEKDPFVCVKTVRRPAHNFLIERAHTNLQALNRSTENSGFDQVFPKALALELHDGIAFSIETALSGRRCSANDSELVLKAIEGFQRHVAGTEKKTSSCSEQISNALKSFGPEWSAKLTEFASSLSGYDDQIECVPQHGDVTPDNVFIDGTSVKIIDCEGFGEIIVAGFDAYHFSRRNGMNVDAKGIAEALLFLYFICDASIKKGYILEKSSPEELISQFKAMLN